MINGTYQVADLSSNNADRPITVEDFDQVKAYGIDGLFIKATEGANYIDPYYAIWSLEAYTANLGVRAYHFADFTSVASEAEHFISVAGPLAVILDIEASQNVAWSAAFLNMLPAPAQQKLGYGSSSSCILQLPALPWVADPGALSPPNSADVLLQYTWTGNIPGITGSVDVSKWTGTQAQWNTFWNIPSPAGQHLRSSADMALASAPRLDGSGIDQFTSTPNGVIQWTALVPYWVPGSVTTVSPTNPTPAVSINAAWLDSNTLWLSYEDAQGAVRQNALHPTTSWSVWGDWETLPD